ncbi:MAG: hypothetical protein JW760_03115, partial [Spirochaetales bacterium]|nr:hypothetical protein [Spirochaetales bacterium]
MTVTLLVSTACLLQTVFFTGLALFIFRRKLLIGSNLFTFLSLSLAVYSLGAAMQPLLHNLAWMLFWNNFIYLGMVWIGPLWLLLALEYSGFDTGTKPGIVVALSLIPLATLILKYHPETSRLIYPEVGINENDLIWVIYFTRGPWYWVHVTHTILSVLVGDILIIKVFFQATPGFRRQGSCMLAASAIPFLSLLLYIPGNLLHGMDLIPLGFTITAVFLALGLFRYDLFNNKPVSWESIVQAAGTGIIVLDGNSNLVEMNTAAAKLFPQNRRGSLGLSIHDIPGLEKLDLDKGADRRDFRLEKEKEKISGTAEVSLIHDGSGRVISRT